LTWVAVTTLSQKKVGQSFDEIAGIDVEPDRLEDFRAHAPADPIHTIKQMSASAIDFPGDFFSLVTAFEVLEHVAELAPAIREVVRVCRPGGLIVISVPQVWFPFENHGIAIGTTTYRGKVPLLPYIRPLHRKYSLARVFSSRQMDRLFLSEGTTILATGYVAPQFERAASRHDSWEGKLKFLRSFLTRCETVPGLRCLAGVSMLKAYCKPL
jgi:2-polyprenyl-3-methyl-5-hydroxy-6-metoxy-1,4-benzoquinol methylase